MGELELHVRHSLGGMCRRRLVIAERGRVFASSRAVAYFDIAAIRPMAIALSRRRVLAKSPKFDQFAGNPESPGNPNFPRNRRFSRKSPKSGCPPRNQAVGFSQFYANCRYSGSFAPLGCPAQRRIPRILDCGCDWRCAFCAVSSGAGCTGYVAHQLRAPDLSGIWRSMPRRQI